MRELAAGATRAAVRAEIARLVAELEAARLLLRQLQPGRAPRRPVAEAEADLRNYAVQRGEEWWGLAEAAEAVGRRADLVARLLPRLLERGTLEENGAPPRSSLRRYRWAGKPEPAAAPARPRRRRRFDYAGGLAGTGRARVGTTDKDLADVIARARARGWRVEAGGKHDRLVHTSGAIVSLSRTPSDHRAVANFEALLRREEA